MTPRERLEAAVADLGEDEVRVLALLAVRLRAGRDCYGPLTLATDRRDFTGEAAAEALDCCAYLAMRLLQERQETPR